MVDKFKDKNMVIDVTAVENICDVTCDCSHFIVAYRGTEILFYGTCGQITGKDISMFYCDTKQEMMDEIDKIWREYGI